MPELQADWTGRTSRCYFNQASQSGHQRQNVFEVGQFSQAGIESQQQVFIISERRKPSQRCQSLLKVIEEPQSEAYIFFLTSDEEKILPTIRSRTVFHFKEQERKKLM